jgi:hypothetical protein
MIQSAVPAATLNSAVTSFLFGKNPSGKRCFLQLALFLTLTIILIQFFHSQKNSQLIIRTKNDGAVIIPFSVVDIPHALQDLSFAGNNEPECHHPGMTGITSWVCGHPSVLHLISSASSGFLHHGQTFTIENLYTVTASQAYPPIRGTSVPVPSPPPKIIF